MSVPKFHWLVATAVILIGPMAVGVVVNDQLLQLPGAIGVANWRVPLRPILISTLVTVPGSPQAVPLTVSGTPTRRLLTEVISTSVIGCSTSEMGSVTLSSSMTASRVPMSVIFRLVAM